MATKWPRTSKSSWPSQGYINQRLREIFGKMATKATNIGQVDIYFFNILLLQTIYEHLRMIYYSGRSTHTINIETQKKKE